MNRETVFYKEEYVARGNKNVIPNSAQHNVPAWTLFAMFFHRYSLCQRDDQGKRGWQPVASAYHARFLYNDHAQQDPCLPGRLLPSVYFDHADGSISFPSFRTYLHYTITGKMTSLTVMAFCSCPGCHRIWHSHWNNCPYTSAGRHIWLHFSSNPRRCRRYLGTCFHDATLFQGF